MDDGRQTMVRKGDFRVLRELPEEHGTGGSLMLPGLRSLRLRMFRRLETPDSEPFRLPMSKIFLVLLLLLLVTSATWIPGVPFRTAGARDLASVRGDGNDPYLELSITPSLANVGTLVTLQITYHNIGEPYLYLSIDPAENVEYAAEVPGNCDYSVRSNACSISILRTLKTGDVTFRASATGEIFDESCQCWRWSVAFDNGPAILHIGKLVFLPLIQRRLQVLDLQARESSIPPSLIP